MKWSSKLPVLFLLTVFNSAALASDSLELKYDPFSILENSSKLANRKAMGKAAAVAPVTWRRELRATIVAGQKSVANVDGKIVQLGEKIDGYTLIAVKKKTAVLEKNSKRVVLKMSPKRKLK